MEIQVYEGDGVKKFDDNYISVPHDLISDYIAHPIWVLDNGLRNTEYVLSDVHQLRFRTGGPQHKSVRSLVNRILRTAVGCAPLSVTLEGDFAHYPVVLTSKVLVSWTQSENPAPLWTVLWLADFASNQHHAVNEAVHRGTPRLLDES